MGVTVHYRGRIDNVANIDSLEDRVIDLVLACGGQLQIWRSTAADNPERSVRGLIVNLEPGQESFTLLFSPEGYLIPLTEIEQAENHPLTAPPWCFAKTQFGSTVGHAVLVETLTTSARFVGSAHERPMGLCARRDARCGMGDAGQVFLWHRERSNLSRGALAAHDH